MEASGSGKRLQPSVSETMEPDLEGFDDFTIASSWERFIAGVETACREWMSTPRPQLLAAGAEKVEGVSNLYNVNKELSFDSRSFRLDFYLQAASEDGREEWKDGLHPLQIWFNVTDFLVMSPSDIAAGVVDTSDASLLLSTMAVALANCGSQLPAFVPVHEPKGKAYQGILGTKTYSARFEADRITSWVPVRFMHLEGLYDLFVSKLAFKTAGDLMVPSVNLEFAMRLTYRTPAPSSRNYMEAESPKVKSKDWDADCPWADWHTLEDPVKGFELVTTWRRRTVTSSVEMAEHENASTSEADKWLLSLVDATEQKDPEKEELVGFAGRLPSLVLAFHVANEAKVLEDFAAADHPYIQHITQSLDLPDPVEVDRVLKDVFQEGKTVTGCGGMDQDYAHGVKGAPADSLFSRFCLHALQLGGCNIRGTDVMKSVGSGGNLSLPCTMEGAAIAVLWIEFVREVRLFWEQGDRLPRMPTDAAPDLATCLLHQKLQLLALCIQQKAQQKAHKQTPADTAAAQQKFLSPGASPAVEKKAVEVPPEEPKHLKVDTSVSQNHKVVPPVDVPGYASSEENWEDTTDEQLEMDSVFAPQEEVCRGSDGRAGTMKLLNSPRSLHAPVNQKLPAMTEDMLEERQQTIAALFKSPSLSQMDKGASTQIQSRILASDMSAFKAANPGALLEDFVRWQSPKDWLESADTSDNKAAGSEELGETTTARGMLSEHISKPGSLWRQIWDNVGAHPAEDQRPLFDYTREGEKVMHYLDTIQPQELIAQMLATSYLLVADGLKRSLTDYMVPPSLAQQLEELYTTMASLLPALHAPKQEGADREPDVHIDLLHLCSVFERVEASVLLAVSLGKKLKQAPRLLALFLDKYLGRKPKAAPRLVVENITSRQWKDGGASEREVVASLFPPLGPTQAWRKSLRMGNFLNGHEPAVREIIFSCCYDVFDLYRDGSRRQRISTQDAYTHRMYISGTSTDLQVSFSVNSTD